MKKRKITIITLTVILVITIIILLDTSKIHHYEKHKGIILKSTSLVDAIFYKKGTTTDEYNLTLEIIPFVKDINVNITFIIPDNVEIVSGNKSLNFTFKNKETKKILLTVKNISGEERLIEASITAEYESKKSHLAKGVRIGSSLRKESESETDSKGRPVKEYQGKKKIIPKY